MAYYAVLIMDLCTDIPGIVPPLLGKIFPLLYDSLTSSYDPTVYRRFREWFVLHLSNFGLKWKWGELKNLPALPEHHVKRQFFVDVLYQLTKLAYPKNVAEAIGADLAPLLPPSPFPQYRLTAESTLFSGFFFPHFL